MRFLWESWSAFRAFFLAIIVLMAGMAYLILIILWYGTGRLLRIPMGRIEDGFERCIMPWVDKIDNTLSRIRIPVTDID